MFCSWKSNIKRTLRAAMVLITCGLAGAGQAGDILVFAAASTKNAMDEIATTYQAKTGHTITLSYAGSSVLARQIQQGAPVDIFISANVDWMDALQSDALIDPTTRVDLLGNSLALVAPAESALTIDIDDADTIVTALQGHWMAMALVNAVPAGLYGKAALQTLGIWGKVAPNVVQSDNARTALAQVSLGAVTMGIVYASDAMATDSVVTLAVFPPETHPPIVYPVASVGALTMARSDFLTYLTSGSARQIFERHGFVVLGG